MPFDFNGDEGKNNKKSGNGMYKAGVPHGFQNTESTSARGFQNTPARKNPGNPYPLSSSAQKEDTYWKRGGNVRRTQEKRSVPRGNIIIPWRVILMMIGVALFIAVLWIYRDAISAFLAQVLSWVITILIIVFLVKILIHRR